MTANACASSSVLTKQNEKQNKIEKMHKRVAACNTPRLATATPHKSSLRDKLHEKLRRVTGPLHSLSTDRFF